MKWAVCLINNSKVCLLFWRLVACGMLSCEQDILFIFCKCYDYSSYSC